MLDGEEDGREREEVRGVNAEMERVEEGGVVVGG